MFFASLLIFFLFMRLFLGFANVLCLLFCIIFFLFFVCLLVLPKFYASLFKFVICFCASVLSMLLIYIYFFFCVCGSVLPIISASFLIFFSFLLCLCLGFANVRMPLNFRVFFLLLCVSRSVLPLFYAS